MKSRVVFLLSLLVVTAIALGLGFKAFGGEGPSHSSDIWARMAMAEKVSIFTIDPGSDENKYSNGIYNYHRFGYDVIDFRNVDNKADILYLSGLGMQMDALNSSTQALCFEPRHAINFDGYWVLICFQCMQYESTYGHGQISDFHIKEFNDFFEAYGLTPLRPEVKDREYDYIPTDLDGVDTVRRQLSKRYFELTKTSASNELIKECWVRGELQIDIEYKENMTTDVSNSDE